MFSSLEILRTVEGKVRELHDKYIELHVNIYVPYYYMEL